MCKLKILFSGLLLLVSLSVTSQLQFSTEIIAGAEQVEVYKPLLEYKSIALVANQSSLVKSSHLVDTLLASGIHIKKVFCPEHGFRGKADAGETIIDGIDTKTGIPLISLYGKNKKPSIDQLNGIDLVVFDIQDVGVRFYTYISSLHYVMEACAENHIPLLVLDRPNPNGFYVDGPVLDTIYSSFVGMHPVPLVHGMTIAEYALMINGEFWLNGERQCNLSVVPCKKYHHNTLYELPVKPSPNLPNIRSVLLYPSLGLFEGTLVSVGRGTSFPFQVYGHPDLKKGKFTFTPESVEGAKYPKLENEKCKGSDLRLIGINDITSKGKIDLSFIISSYNELHMKTDFFNSYFVKLAGTSELQKQIEKGLTEAEIRTSWKPKLTAYKTIRKKYLLYPDFE